MHFLIFSVFAITVAVATGVGAGDLGPRDNLELGVQYFDAGSFKEAYDQLFEAFILDPGNPEINFHLGPFEIGDYEAGGMAYERMLIPQLNLSRTKLEMALNHAYGFEGDRTYLKTPDLKDNGFYQFSDDFDQDYFNLTTGSEIQFGKYILEVQGILNQLHLSYDNYLGTYGLGTIVSYAPKPGILFNLGLSGLQKDFSQYEDRDAFNLGAASNAFWFSAPNRVGVGMTGEYENAENDLHSYHRYRINFRYDRLFPNGFNAFAGYRYQKTEYDEEEPMFAKKRSDDLNEIIAGISKTLWRSDDNRHILTAFISFTYTDSNSNIDFYTYDINVIVTALELRF